MFETSRLTVVRLFQSEEGKCGWSNSEREQDNVIFGNKQIVYVTVEVVLYTQDLD